MTLPIDLPSLFPFYTTGCSLSSPSPPSPFPINNRPHGYLYDKEAILECLLHQKRESKAMFSTSCVRMCVSRCYIIDHLLIDARKMKEYDKQKRKHEVCVCVCVRACVRVDR